MTIIQIQIVVILEFREKKNRVLLSSCDVFLGFFIDLKDNYSDYLTYQFFFAFELILQVKQDFILDQDLVIC